MSLMPLPELEAWLARFAGIHVGVIGDFALDAYWTIEPAAALPSVETGLPTQPIAEQRYAAGAAGNVVANLVALGCARVAAFGVVGRDPWGAELLRILQELGADVGGMARQERDWATVVYAKPHVGGREQSRIDFGDFNRLRADYLHRQNSSADSPPAAYRDDSEHPPVWSDVLTLADQLDQDDPPPRRRRTTPIDTAGVPDDTP